MNIVKNEALKCSFQSEYSEEEQLRLQQLFCV